MQRLKFEFWTCPELIKTTNFRRRKSFKPELKALTMPRVDKNFARCSVTWTIKNITPENASQMSLARTPTFQIWLGDNETIWWELPGNPNHNLNNEFIQASEHHQSAVRHWRRGLVQRVSLEHGLQARSQLPLQTVRLPAQVKRIGILPQIVHRRFFRNERFGME